MLKNKIKNLIEKKTNGDNKKTIENLVVFLILLVITVVSINLIWGKSNQNKEKQKNDESYKVLAETQTSSNNSQTVEYNLEKELENILSKISGVGKVQVLVTYSQTSTVVAMSNSTTNTSKTEETDSNRRNKNNRINR